MPTNYQELGWSPKEWWSPEGHFAAERVLLCAWDDRFNLIGDLAAGGPGGGPEKYPHTDRYECYAVAASAKPLDKQKIEQDFGVGGKEITDYDKAVVTVQYSTDCKYLIAGSNKFVYEEYDSTAEMRNIDNVEGGYSWATSGVQVPQNDMPGRIECGGALKMTFFNISSWSGATRTMRGWVNATPNITWTLGMSFPPRTLLYQGFHVVRVVDMGFTPIYRITFEWYEKLPSWDHVYNPATGNDELITNPAGDTDWRFKEGDFGSLIPV